jgi:hypothetical protein
LLPLCREKGVEEEQAAQSASAVVGGEGAEGSKEGCSPGWEPGYFLKCVSVAAVGARHTEGCTRVVGKWMLLWLGARAVPSSATKFG